MMRSIGFSRRPVILGIVIELVTLSIIGLVTGIINGVLFADSLVANFFGFPTVYPVETILMYIIGVIGMAIIAGAVPAYNAAKITPSEALRYTG